jgi:predicted MFS family arabinose efflux permease
MSQVPVTVMSEGIPQRRTLALLMLIVVYTFNFIDRQIVGILAVPIKADLALTDAQLGLMGGLAFAIFYTGLGIPVAMLADRTNRAWIITIALTVWSGTTAACGLATNFWQLFLARLGVGVGEAGGVTPAYSMIMDLYPPGQRARALSAYSFGIPIGSALGILLGGVLASLIDWRYAFFAVGLAGIVLAPLFRLVVREPERGRFDRQPRAERPPDLREIARALGGKPSFWLLALGASCSSMMGYGLFFWMPSFIVRSHGLSLLHASFFYGAILLIGGMAGMWAGGWLGDHFGKLKRTRFVTIPALAFILSMPAYVFGVLTPTLTLAFFVLMVPVALGLVWVGPVMSSVQQLVRPDMRATASAVFLFINNLLGIGLGTWLIGALSDALAVHYAENSLRYSIVAGTGFYLLAAGLFWLASRWLEEDWEE